MRKKHIGSSLDNHLTNDDSFEETQALAVKEVVVTTHRSDAEAIVEQDALGDPSEDQPIASRSAAGPLARCDALNPAACGSLGRAQGADRTGMTDAQDEHAHPRSRRHHANVDSHHVAEGAFPHGVWPWCM